MKSGTSFFNWPLFRKTVLRFWPIWAIYAVVLLAQGPFRLAGWLRGAQDAVEAARYAQQVPARAATELAVFFVPACCVAAAMAVYSHLYFSALRRSLRRSANKARGGLRLRHDGWAAAHPGAQPHRRPRLPHSGRGPVPGGAARGGGHDGFALPGQPLPISALRLSAHS